MSLSLTLDELAIKYGTDKATTDHGYTKVYEQLFGHLRDEPVQLAELGVYAGASLQMWDDYFTNSDSDIIGVDCGIIDDLPKFGPRVRVYQGDQTEVPEQVRDLLFDIIVDDASHQSSKTITSFIRWWSYLKPGGLYIVEDITTSYYLGPEGCPNPDHSPHNLYRMTAMQWFKSMADLVNAWAYPSQFQPIGRFEIAAVAFRPNLVIVEKK